MTTLTLTLLVIVKMMIMGCREIIISLASFKKIEIWLGLVLKRKKGTTFKKNWLNPKFGQGVFGHLAE
jgi:hypothetical protein